MKKIEGYWYERHFGEQYPMPVSNTIDQSIKKFFVEKLKIVEEVSHKNGYIGTSRCRICNCSNGIYEYSYRGWSWPEGYMHYINVHNVSPSKEFFDFIMNA